MSGQPKLTTLGLWAEFERRCLHLLREALVALAAEPDDMVEIDLNRRLFFEITRVARQMTEWEVGAVLPGTDARCSELSRRFGSRAY